MNLVLFDIDGTLVDSVKADDDCFIQSFRDLHEIDLSGADWNDFQNVTDSGLTIEIFESHFGRQPKENEISDLQAHFYGLLNQRKSEFTEIEGASSTLQYLNRHSDICMAFATGGWKETAELKLSTLPIKIDGLILASANDHIERTGITKLAIKQSLEKYQLHDFDSVTYVGDGLWDLRTALALGINFIGIDYRKDKKLTNAGVKHVIPNLTDGKQILKWVKGTNEFI